MYLDRTYQFLRAKQMICHEHAYIKVSSGDILCLHVYGDIHKNTNTAKPLIESANFKNPKT